MSGKVLQQCSLNLGISLFRIKGKKSGEVKMIKNSNLVEDILVGQHQTTNGKISVTLLMLSD